MHRFQRDPHSGVFTALLDGETTSADLAQAVTACLEGVQTELKAVWIVQKMSVSFTSDEIAKLMQSVSKLPIPPGRIAFVTGTSAFLKSLTDLSEDLRPNKRLEWRSFPTTDEAFEWAAGFDGRR